MKMASFEPPSRLRVHSTGRCKLLQVIAFLLTPSSALAMNEHCSRDAFQTEHEYHSMIKCLNAIPDDAVNAEVIMGDCSQN